MSGTTANDPGLGDHPVGNRPPPAFVDWLLGALIALCGMTAIVGGSALAVLVDRDELAAAIEEDEITVTVGMTELTDDEAVTVADAVVSWTGTGLLVVGVLMVLFAIGYVIVRHRKHRRYRDGQAISSYGAFALLGGLATAVLSFIPFSPALGGAVAGYLERGESDRTISVGALAGVIPALPILGLVIFVLGGVVDGMIAIDQAGVALVVAATLVLALLFLIVFTAGLGALGGYLGGRFALSQSDRA